MKEPDGKWKIRMPIWILIAKETLPLSAINSSAFAHRCPLLFPPQQMCIQLGPGLRLFTPVTFSAHSFPTFAGGALWLHKFPQCLSSSLEPQQVRDREGEKVLRCVDYCVFVIWNGISCRYSISRRWFMVPVSQHQRFVCCSVEDECSAVSPGRAVFLSLCSAHSLPISRHWT